MHNKSHWITLAAVLLVMTLALTACELPEEGIQRTPSGGEPGQGEPAPEQPVEAPPEPAPTEEPAAPEAPAEPAAPAPTQAPAESGGETSAEGDLLKIFIVLAIILLVIGVILMIVAALGGRGKSQAPAAEGPPAPAAEQASAALTVEDHLDIATPKAADLYKRFTELVQTYGQVSIVPTQTRIDFRVRAIFASVEFREDSLLVLLVLPERLESPRIIRVDTYTQSSFANYTYIRTFDDYDAEFSAWLQEAYNLGVRGM